MKPLKKSVCRNPKCGRKIDSGEFCNNAHCEFQPISEEWEKNIAEITTKAFTMIGQYARFSDYLDKNISSLLSQSRTQVLEELREKVEGMKKEHQHSIYTHCRACHTWGVNMPDDKVCGNCENKEDTTTYYPDDSYNQALNDVLEEIKK